MAEVVLDNKDAILPKRGTPLSAGFDVYSISDEIIEPGKHEAVDLGIKIKCPEGYYARLAPRSGLAFKYGIQVLAGVIDADYRDTVKVILLNGGDTKFKINKGDRIAQLIFEKIYTGNIIAVEELDQTERKGGFGSTGK